MLQLNLNQEFLQRRCNFLFNSGQLRYNFECMEIEKDNLENGIHPLHESLYIECILSATESANSSLEEIDFILYDPKLIENIGLKIIDLCENIIIQAGIISKYFDPPSKKKIHKLRGEKLRKSFQIEDGSFIMNRDFRNHIEHFDERLDTFLKNPIIGEIIPKSLFQSSIEINSIKTVFKAFVIDEEKLISLGEEIKIVPLMKEIYRIHDFSLGFINNGGRLPNP